MGIYREAEKSYSDVLFNHIVSNKIFPYNDGVLREAQAGLGGKGRRFDLVTRYKHPDTYFAIEVKYFPTNFEEGFKQAGQLYNVVDCAYVAVPVSYANAWYDALKTTLTPRSSNSRFKLSSSNLLSISESLPI